MKMTIDELNFRVNMSLRDKIDYSTEKIEQWHNHFDGNVYVAFSGGKDSRVLKDLVERIFPEIPSVYNDTGLEYPEIKQFVKTFGDVIITRPRLTYRQVIEKYGFAVISKEQSHFIDEYRNTRSEKLKNIRLNGNRWGMGKISKKWLFMLDAPFKISQKCCDILKKNPSKIYERKTGRKGMIGSTTEESFMRKQTYLRFGCNAYETKRPISMPIAFWREQDVLQYIRKYSLSLPSIYGEIKEREDGKLYLSGINRSGCMWCLFGLDKEKNELNRIQKLKLSHPKIYDYVINDMKIGDVLDFMEISYD